MEYKVIRAEKINLASISAYLLMLLVFFQSILNKILITILPIDNIIGYVMLLCTMVVIFTNRLRINRKFLIFYFACWGLLIYSIIFIGGSAIQGYIIQFLSFGSCGIVCAFVQIDFQKFFKYGGIATAIFLILTLLEGFADAKYSAFAFGYALMPGIISIFYLIYNSYLQKKWEYMLVWAALEILGLFCLLHYCSRGNLLQLYIFAVLCLFLIFKKKILGTISVLAVVIGVIFIEPIIMVLYQIMEDMGIFISVIWKNYWLLTTPGQTLIHGREDFYINVFCDLDITSFLVGHGVGAYENIYESYVHNIFLQAFYECGIVGIGFIIFVYAVFIKMMFNKRNTVYEREIYIMLFVLTLVKLCLSDIHWKVSLFWFVIAFLFDKLERKKSKNMLTIKV